MVLYGAKQHIGTIEKELWSYGVSATWRDTLKTLSSRVLSYIPFNIQSHVTG